MVGVLSCLFAHVNEVAGGLSLARDVGLEVTVDTVLQLVVESLTQDCFEILQAMGVVG